ncbi:MAG: NADH-quinone oxidoreductase subunit K [Methanoregulaceae archaeon]|nr:NADH-quinone oxidoreductase subunit K [Methanoregulaceae archaeon]
MIAPEILALFAVAAALFSIGLAALVTRQNLITIVIGLELLGKGVSLVFITAGYIAGNVADSQAVVFTLIIIEAVVAGVALALVILYKRVWKTLEIASAMGITGRGDT